LKGIRSGMPRDSFDIAGIVTPTLLALLLGLSGCTHSSASFSQYPGFAEYYGSHPPRSNLPDARERALLERFRPHVWIAAGAHPPVSFYDDYIASGVLYDGQGRPVSERVDRTALNASKHDPAAVFVHRRPARPTRSEVLARVDYEPVPAALGRPGASLAFLTYNLVFPTSGVPAGLAWWQRLAVGLIADPADWHQLDHYTAVTLVVEDPDAEARPIAAILQQHNNQRAYLIASGSTAGTLALERDRRCAVDVAIGSNELYPHRPGRSVRRAVSMLTADTAAYLVTGADHPWFAGDDVTDPALEIDYSLAYLPPSDAFYMFEGWLGERRRLPGRDGPPGADYYTLPSLKSRTAQLALFWWYEEDRVVLAQLQRALGDSYRGQVDLSPFMQRLAAGLAAARRAD